MATVEDDLPYDIKEIFKRELKLNNYVLDHNEPIGKGAFGFVYKIREVTVNWIKACKVILIINGYNIKTRELQLKSISEEIFSM